MSSARLMLRALMFAMAVLPLTRSAEAQAPPPPPLWDVQVGASFVGTSGNSDSSSFGGDFSLHRRWVIWQIESTANAVHTTTEDVSTAERYLWTLRGQRRLTDRI